MGFLARVRALFTGSRTPELTTDDPGLAVVAASFDDAEAPSAALARATALRAGDQAVLRHHLRLPADRVDEAARLIAQDGYVLRENGPPEGDLSPVAALRVQLVDALHCAQERSRMASLAQRLGGTALGWDVLQTSGRETDNIDAPDLA
ncbi:hypothetical protein [Actinokineospora sp. NBRC 105648]|uniref:hypothetical protein n=1 Tax=Actinokineospora sp. NBRC 105648 TaxID=3032206 RepID=UPI0024A39904|nr:hypothetical protein [Actinokineospora sp. NBRC 105648]GLZ39177.1 hypothetical protein Acsp05_28010 [Actinokineospora sp. NBRC 105648]